MPTIISHPAVLLALYPAYRKNHLPGKIFAVGAVCSILPDVDVLGFGFGIRYEDLLGHRGLTHSIAFAALTAGFITIYLGVKHRLWIRSRWSVFAFLFMCTVSHGLLDALTDGGLGVAFFSPFSNHRYFFPWRPLKVSPIGIDAFLTGPAWRVLQSELLIVWLPCMIIFMTGILLRWNHQRQKTRT